MLKRGAEIGRNLQGLDKKYVGLDKKYMGLDKNYVNKYDIIAL